MDLRDHLYAKAPYLTGATKASDNAPDFADAGGGRAGDFLDRVEAATTEQNS